MFRATVFSNTISVANSTKLSSDLVVSNETKPEINSVANSAYLISDLNVSETTKLSSNLVSQKILLWTVVDF